MRPRFSAIALVLSCFWTSIVVAEEVRFSRQLVISVALQHAVRDIVPSADGVFSVSVSLLDLLQKATFVYQSQIRLEYPDEIVAVFAVKAEGGEIRSVLRAPMEHQGGGSFGWDDFQSLFYWFAAHHSDFEAEDLVLERFDGLHGRLAEMNPGPVSGSMEFWIDGLRVNTPPRRLDESDRARLAKQ